MEQYIEMLIPRDPDFSPEPAQVATFFEIIEKSWQFDLDQTNPHMPALRVLRLPSKAEVENANEGFRTDEYISASGASRA